MSIDLDTISPGAAATPIGEEMFHPDKLFVDPSYAELSLRDLAFQFDRWLRGRAKPIKPKSVKKYKYSVNCLLEVMTQNEIPLTLKYLHPYSLDTWVATRRAAGQSEEGTASILSSIKVFSNSFITKQLELTLSDPLRKVPRIEPPEREVDILDADEIEAVLSTYGDVTFEDIRNKAFMAVLLSTGTRLMEARELTLGQWDPTSGELTLHGKGDRIRYAQLSDRAAKLLRAYLRLRPRHSSGMLWLTRTGTPLTEGGWYMVMRRLKRRSGVSRVHFHLMRHTFGSVAITKGAERAAVQDMMGHQSDYMTRRYTREARKRTAAAMMPQFSPI